jgi:hypothetical protein
MHHVTDLHRASGNAIDYPIAIAPGHLSPQAGSLDWSTDHRIVPQQVGSAANIDEHTLGRRRVSLTQKSLTRRRLATARGEKARSATPAEQGLDLGRIGRLERLRVDLPQPSHLPGVKPGAVVRPRM